VFLFGGRLQYLTTGGAPTAPAVMSFLRAVFHQARFENNNNRKMFDTELKIELMIRMELLKLEASLGMEWFLQMVK
jgi:hypothetical protein